MGHLIGDARKRLAPEPPVRTYTGTDESGLQWMVEYLGDVVRVATRRDTDAWCPPLVLNAVHDCRHSVLSPEGRCISCGEERP